MKKLILIGVAAVLTACSSSEFIAHKISETPEMTRQALIFEDHVVIVTRTTMSKEKYYALVAQTVNNRPE